MGSKQRFLIGGAGALMPILITLLSIDFVTVIDEKSSVSSGHIIGYSIRYLVLFIIGGTIAYLHVEENKPYKIFQLGIAAPALITSFITANGINSNITGNDTTISMPSINIISSAYAESSHNSNQSDFLGDIFSAFSGNSYQIQQQMIVNKKQTLSKRESVENEDVEPTTSIIATIQNKQELEIKMQQAKVAYEQYAKQLEQITAENVPTIASPANITTRTSTSTSSSAVIR